MSSIDGNVVLVQHQFAGTRHSACPAHNRVDLQLIRASMARKLLVRAVALASSSIWL